MNDTQKPSLEKAVKQMSNYKTEFEGEFEDEFWNESMNLFRKVATNDSLRGRCVKTVYASCVYLLVKQTEPSITAEDLAGPCEKELSENKILRTSRYIQRETDVQIEPVRIEDVLQTYFEKLEFTRETREYTLELLQECQEENIVSGKSPRAFSAGLLYLSGLLSDEDVSQNCVMEVANVSEVTVRNRYQEQASVLGLEEKVEEAKPN